LVIQINRISHHRFFFDSVANVNAIAARRENDGAAAIPAPKFLLDSHWDKKWVMSPQVNLASLMSGLAIVFAWR
jgi:hypothetical protein